MGFRCPVCSDPQADDRHLANHLAFTAVVRGGDHETWLDEHVSDWEQMDDEELASYVSELATSVEFPQIFEDTTDQSHTHHGYADVSNEFDEATRAAIERAQELIQANGESDQTEN